MAIFGSNKCGYAVAAAGPALPSQRLSGVAEESGWRLTLQLYRPYGYCWPATSGSGGGWLNSGGTDVYSFVFSFSADPVKEAEAIEILILSAYNTIWPKAYIVSIEKEEAFYH